MKEFATKNKFALAFFVAGFILIVAGWWWAYVALHQITQPLIIHFNSRDGINQIGGMGDLTGMALLSLLIVCVNFAIFWELEKRDRVWSVIVASATLLYCALIFIGFKVIIGVN